MRKELDQRVFLESIQGARQNEDIDRSKAAAFPLNFLPEDLRFIGDARRADRRVNPAGGILVAMGRLREHCPCLAAAAISSNPPAAFR